MKSTIVVPAAWIRRLRQARRAVHLRRGRIAFTPRNPDAYGADAYDDFDASTMVCPAFPPGGVDTCQGDSGGPMFGRDATGAVKVVGATS